MLYSDTGSISGTGFGDPEGHHDLRKVLQDVYVTISYEVSGKYSHLVNPHQCSECQSIAVVRAQEDLYSKTFLIVYIVVGDCILLLRLEELAVLIAVKERIVQVFLRNYQLSCRSLWLFQLILFEIRLSLIGTRNRSLSSSP